MLALPFVLGLLGTRALVEPAAAAVASALPAPERAARPVSPRAEPAPDPSPLGTTGPILARSDAPAAALARPDGPNASSVRSAGPAASADDPREGDAPQTKEGGTIVVSSSAVARALEKRDVGAANATAPDGTAMGVRLIHVSHYRTGLRDGDIVVAVSGTKTPDVATLVAVGMQAASSGAPRISGRILRGAVGFNVLLELPK